MSVVSARISLKTRGDCDIHDVTPQVAEAVRASGLRAGTVTVFVPGSTGGITTVEFEDGLVHDLQAMFDRLAPQDPHAQRNPSTPRTTRTDPDSQGPSAVTYAHNERWGDGNGHSHCRSSLLGPSLTVPFIDDTPSLRPF